MVARRYGAPLASLRNSLYDLLYDDAAAQLLLGATRSTLMADYVHPTAAGFKVYGDVVSYTVRQTLSAVFANGADDPFSIALSASGGLPHPISPVAAQQDTDVWCKEGSSFKTIASCIDKTGSCQWKTAGFNVACPHMNCRIRGYFLKGQGQMLHIQVDTSKAAGADNSTAGAGNSTAGESNSTTGNPSTGNSSSTGSLPSSADQFKRRYLAVTYLQGSVMPAERMGIAYITCVQGCRCKRVQLAFRGEVSTGIAAIEVSCNRQCMLTCATICLRTSTASSMSCHHGSTDSFLCSSQVDCVCCCCQVHITSAKPCLVQGLSRKSIPCSNYKFFQES
jgi:hypothetical protein